MFILPEELKTVAYAYQVTQITEADADITLQAIAAAEQELRSYLMPNNRKEWQDGRPHYDTDAILSATGANRNALLLEMCKNMALWYLVRLCHVDMLYEQVKERYDRAVEWLNKLSKGAITLNLPLLPPAPVEEGTGEGNPFRHGSRTKFNHE